MIKHTHNAGTTRAGGLARALAALALVLLMQSPALGAGTAAGTVITNQAYADYQDPNGNAMARVFSNSVTTIVSQVAGVDVAYVGERGFVSELRAVLDGWLGGVGMVHGETN